MVEPDRSVPPGPPPSDPQAAARERAGELARGLARQEVRVSVALALLERAERDADVAASRMAAATQELATAGGVSVPHLASATIDDAPLHPAVVEAEQIVRLRAAELARRTRRRRLPSTRIEGIIAGAASFALFAGIGTVLALRAGVLPGDAISRVQNAQAVIAGRDPHPEAIGFVWGPFPTAFQVPLTWFRAWWPALTGQAVAAVLVSAAFMAGTVVQLLGWGRDAGAPRWFRICAIVLAVAHPLVWIYGANGMSEACGTFFLVLAARHLARWLDNDDVRPLAVCGIALGMAYLARYEAVTAAMGVAVVVAVVSSGRQPRAWSGRDRRRGVAVDLTVVAFPAVAAVVGWAAASWVIIGEPFAQFSSEYGNSALVRAAGGGGAIIGDLTAPGRAWFFLRQLVVAAPLLALLVLLVLWLGDRAATRATAALAVLGAPVALQLLLATSGKTFPWFRYVNGAVALALLLALVVGGSATGGSRRWLRPVALLALVPGVVASTVVMRSGELGAAADDAPFLRGISTVADGGRPDRRTSITAGASRVAEDVDRLRGVVPGAVLTDTSSTFAVLAAAPRPDVYVIPSDRDFEAVVSDPATFGVRYLLLRSPATPGDALVRQYPRLWADDGRPVARLVRSWGDAGDRAGEYRLYAVDHPAARTRPTPEDGFTP